MLAQNNFNPTPIPIKTPIKACIRKLRLAGSR